MSSRPVILALRYIKFEMDELETYTSTPNPTTRVILHEITVHLFTYTRIVGRVVIVVVVAFCSRCSCG